MGVSRRWLELPRWRVWRPRDLDLGDGWAADDLLAGLVLVVAFVLLLAVGVSLLVSLGALVAGLAGLVGRVLFGRPWAVEAKGDRGELAWRVRGLRGSRRAMAEIAAALERGDRTFTPRRAERLLPESPLEGRRRGGTVSVLGRRRRTS